jgi:hypothetical protein
MNSEVRNQRGEESRFFDRWIKSEMTHPVAVFPVLIEKGMVGTTPILDVGRGIFGEGMGRCRLRLRKNPE